MALFLAAARQPKRMAKKIAAMRLFFMLRNKKLITKRPCLAPAGQPVRMRVKNSALHYFLLLRFHLETLNRFFCLRWFRLPSVHLDAILLFLGRFPTTAPAAGRAGCAQKSGWNIKPAPAQSFFLLSGLLYGGEGEAAPLSLRGGGAGKGR